MLKSPLLTSYIAGLITRAIGMREQKIPMTVRRIIEARGGFDLGSIHIHVGSTATTAAKALGARAFSVSRHIMFDEDEFCLTSDEGLWLLAHEIAHAVRQKDGYGLNYSIGALGSVWEYFAHAFADFVLDDASQSIPWLSVLPVAPAGFILRHKGPKCPGPPEWHTISAERPEIWLTANYSIELVYKHSHYGHVMIFGGDFITGQTITLPRDTHLSDIDRRFGNQLLLELKGLMWQLRPDIYNGP